MVSFRRFGIFFLGGLLFKSAVIFGIPDFEARHFVSPKTGTIGDTFLYQVVVTYNASVEFHPLSSLSLAPFVVRNVDTETRFVSRGSEDKVYILRYAIALYDTGTHRVPTLNLSYKKKGGIQNVVLSALPVYIRPILDGKTPTADLTIKNIKEMAYLPYRWRWMVALVGGVLTAFLTCLTALGWFWWRRRQIGDDASAAFDYDDRPADEMAKAALEELTAKQLLESGAIRQYYDELSDIMKTYFSRIFSEKMVEMTTEEVLAFVRGLENEQLLRRFKVFFEACDQVKFAQYSPESSEHADVFDRALDLIDRVLPFYVAPESIVSETKREEPA